MDWLEFYAGKAACTAAMRRAGFTAARFDKLYFREGKSNYHDLLHPAGFVPLSLKCVFRALSRPVSRSPRLAIVYIMKGRRGHFLTWFGIKCSTWVAINSGTSRRSICASMGDTSIPSVAEGNKMLERTPKLNPCWMASIGIIRHLSESSFIAGSHLNPTSLQDSMPRGPRHSLPRGVDCGAARKFSDGILSDLGVLSPKGLPALGL